MKSCDGKSPCCTGSVCLNVVRGQHTLKTLVECYRSAPHSIHTDLKWYSSTNDFSTVVTNAALAITCEGKKHPHQQLLPPAVLEAMKRKLLLCIKGILNARDFDAILSLIEGCKVKGFGKLACYDTALRIAAYLKRMPTQVYLHAGTREGSRALGLSGNVRSLEPSQFPQELQTLKPYEIEDFLCIFEPNLRDLKDA